MEKEESYTALHNINIMQRKKCKEAEASKTKRLETGIEWDSNKKFDSCLPLCCGIEKEIVAFYNAYLCRHKCPG